MKRNKRVIFLFALFITPFAGLGIVFGANFVPFMYEITDLGTLGGSSSVALDINEQGQVVGSADIPGGKRHAYIWEDGVMTDISSSIGTGEAWGINNLSQVVGLISGTGNLAIAFLWEDGILTELNEHTKLGTLIPANALSINDLGQIVGQSVFPDAGGRFAYLWENGVLNDLGALGGNFPHSIAWDINEMGQVVGESSNSVPGRAFLWENGTMSNLGTLGGGTA